MELKVKTDTKRRMGWSGHKLILVTCARTLAAQKCAKCRSRRTSERSGFWMTVLVKVHVRAVAPK